MKISKMFSWVLLVVCLHQNLMSEFTSIPLVSAQELQAEMQECAHCKGRKKSYNPDLLIINVLSPSIGADCHIPGSINVPLHKLAKTSQQWRKDSNIVLHCASLHCPLSTYAFDMLRKLGFTRVRVLNGGLQEWNCKKVPQAGRYSADYLRF